MRLRHLEILVGGFMIRGFAALAFLALQVSGLAAESSKESYKIYAHFENIGGLTLRAKVTMSGVVVGRVTDIALDPKRLNAKVEMSIDKNIDYISTDSIAAIQTAGVLGEKYISISLGGDDKNLTEGGEIKNTQSALVLEELIGKFVGSKLNENSNKSE
ncbi:MAG TPA: outer membrane lipid asymmetry maintenance protein MlaD [Pseudomonadales bacterium]|nr:outer membrane lipid asymmetry maintenance protein MlaD [Pseudomonadales bacterium]